MLSVPRHRALTASPSRRTALVLAALALLAGALTLSAAPARGGASHLVEIVDFAYAPATLTIQAGDTVTWTNLDAVEHTATGTAGAFDTGLLGQNESASITFTQPGTYDYLCTPHPSMVGRIVVVAAAAPTPAPSQAGAPAGGGGTIPDVALLERKGIDGRVIAGIALVALAAASAFLLRRRTQES